MNTPDTEWARNKLNKTYLRLAYGKSDIEKTKKEVDGILNEVRASRDTYWKERVEELKLTEREIEIIVQDTVGQAYQKKFNANLDYDQWVGIRDEMMRCAKRISEKIENNIELNRQALDTLLEKFTNEDNLK